MTAAALLAALRSAGCGPTAAGEELVLHRPPPEPLAGPLAVLHTGVRAALTGRRWLAFDPATGRGCGPFPARGHGPLAFGALDPGRPLPAAAGYLCVEGDSCWDRLPPFARADLPELFAPDIATPARTR